jgi:hypothetical protein
MYVVQYSASVQCTVQCICTLYVRCTVQCRCTLYSTVQMKIVQYRADVYCTVHMYIVQWICALHSYRIYVQKQMVHNKYCLATEWIRNYICLNHAVYALCQLDPLLFCSWSCTVLFKSCQRTMLNLGNYSGRGYLLPELNTYVTGLNMHTTSRLVF